jgi:RHS repeat-associated protein
MKGVSAATAGLQFNNKETNADTGLVTEYWGPTVSEVAPNVGSFEWSVAYCVPLYSSVCAGVYTSQSSLMASIGAGIEAIEGCSPVAWQPSSGWYWNSFSVAGLSDPYLIHAKKDWTLQVPYGSSCNNSKETTVTILARRDAACDDGFDGPSEIQSGSPYWSCRNNQSATIQYYTTEETSPCPETVGNPCDVATGAKIETVVDYEGPGPTFYRTYRSNILMPGVSLLTTMLGPNWTHNYLSAIHWDSTGVLPERLYRPDGGFISLELLNSNVWVAKNGSGIQIRDTDPADFFSDWIVYLPSGAREVYSYYTVGTQLPKPQWRLAELHDPEGRVTTVSYSAQSPTRVAAVTGPFGHSLQFEYSTVFLGFQTRTRLDFIQDPAGNKIDFVFDESYPAAAGNVLTSVIYQDQTEEQYLYSSGYNLGPFQMVGIVDENGDQYAIFEYDEHDRAKSTQHAGGYGYLLLEYDDVNFTTTVTDAGLNQTIYSFQDDSLGIRNPAVITFPDGSTRVQSNEIAGQRRLKYGSDEEGNTTFYAYDDYHRISKKEAYDPGQGTFLRETDYSYLNDTSDLKTEIRSPSVTNCNSAANLKVTNYISGTQLVSSFQETGFDPTDCSQLSRLTTFSDYNAYGQPRQIDGPRGVDANGVDDIATIEYYECSTGGECGQLKKITNALGHETSFLEYDPHGRLKKKMSPNGLLTYYSYDLRGRIDIITEDAGNDVRLTNFAYDAAGQIDRITMPGGLILDYTWNSAHLLDAVSDNHGNRVDYRYDSRGNRIGEDLKDSEGLITKAMTMAFDARNRLDTLQRGSGPVSDLDFDVAGHLQLIVDPNANRTAYEHDDLGRLINVVDALNGVNNSTAFSFDLNDNLTSVSAPNGAMTAFQFDDLGNLLKEISPDRGATLYAYDASGNMTCKADARAGSSSFARCDEVPDRWVYTYDALNRLDTIDYLITPGLDVNYDYDQGAGQQGRLNQVIHESDTGLMVENQYTYDLFGNLIEHRQVTPGAGNVGQSYTTSYQYDSDARVTQITYPNGRLVDYFRDDLGQIIQVTTTSPPYYQAPVTTTLASNVTYYPFGPPKKISYGNDLDQTRLVDDAYRPASLQLGNAGEIWETKLYTTDAVGNILQIVDQQTGNEVAGYAYDPLNRLVWDAAVDSTPATPTFTYDANGNRLTRETDMSVVNQMIEYAPTSNKMTSINGINVYSDQTGNITNSGTGMVAGYNAANRLGSFYKNGTTLSMLYNGLGELVKTTARSSCSCGVCPKVYEYFHFLPDGRALSMTQDSSYKITVDWIWLDGLPIAQIQESFLADGTHDPSSTQITFLISDHLGTPRMGTNNNGQEVWRMQSDAFGRTAITSSGPVVRLRFPGQINYGYAGIYYNYNRDYDSNMGRYLESDPIGLVAGNNTYSYGFNNPLVYIDPYGLHCLSPEVIRGLAGALEGGVSGIPLGWGALAYAAFGAVAGYASAADFPTYSTSGFIPAGVAGAASSLKSGGSGAIGGLVGGLAGGASAEVFGGGIVGSSAGGAIGGAFGGFFGIPIRAPWKNAITAAKNGSVFGLFGGLAGSGLERYLLSTRDKDCDDQGCIQ